MNTKNIALMKECSEILRELITDYPILMKDHILIDVEESQMIVTKLQDAISASDEIRFEYVKNDWGK